MCKNLKQLTFSFSVLVLSMIALVYIVSLSALEQQEKDQLVVNVLTTLHIN